AGDRSRWSLAGDQLYLDLLLSRENLPAGQRLALGTAVIEITDSPHNGCAKFKGRFGVEALRFVNVHPEVRDLRLRGIHARVVHSRGGLVSRWYIEFLGGAGKVGRLVSLAVPHQGSKVANLAMFDGVLNCLSFPFCQQAVTGSDFLRQLNGSDDTFGDVRYTN